MRSVGFLALLLILAYPTPGLASPPLGSQELARELPALIEAQLEAWHVPGLAVGVVMDGDILFMRGFGHRDREAGLPVTTRTLFPIASCSKAFTALGAAMAAADGALDWQAPIRETVPDFEMMDPRATREATLDDFLRHRSGFGEHRFLPRLAGLSRKELFQRLKHLESQGEFREGLLYSNLGYAVAGFLVGRAAGMPWELHTEQRIFEPLGMASTVFTAEEMERSGDFAVGYLNLLDFEAPERCGVATLTTLAPAGGIVSNLEDMVRWLQFNLGDGTAGDRRLISEEQLRILHRPHTDLSSRPEAELITYQGYGYGWWSETYRGSRHVYHGGLGEGYISQVSLLPEEGIGVVVLTNTYYAHLHQALIYHIFDRLLGLSPVDHFDRELTGLRAYMSNWVEEYDSFFDEVDTDPPTSADLADYAGSYGNPAWGPVIVESQDGQLALRFQSGVRLSIRPYDTDTFATDEVGFGLLHRLVKFESDDRGYMVAFTMDLESGVAPIRFVR